MMVPDEVVSVIEGPSAAWMATSDREHRPFATRVHGARLAADRRRLVAYVPAEQAGKTVANLATSPHVAVFFCRVTDYYAVQVKGTLVEVRPAGEAERELTERYTRAWGEVCISIGLAPDLMSRLAYWPSLRIELAIAALFEQTPGPRAGVAL